ncbi:Putative phenylalanine aminotransferase [Geodia barretti]|uniref:histidinol-phosphate transaminase n=2 Tax=Geodia barretti TaxID=519541 RepID=A0AA35T7J9_GEOBA|nr:Putative phenylalanine aminotransferase [Geodia barretti]
MGGTLVRVPLTAGHAFDLDAVAAAVTARTKLVFLATPNNPTARPCRPRPSHASWSGFPDVVVLVDEAYREFADPALGDPVADLLPRFDNVAVARTFSKAYGLASLRLGYVMAHPEVVSAIDKCLIPFNVNGLAQAAPWPPCALTPPRRRRPTSTPSEPSGAGWRPPWPPTAGISRRPGQLRVDAAGQPHRRGVHRPGAAGRGGPAVLGGGHPGDHRHPAQNDRFWPTSARCPPA